MDATLKAKRKIFLFIICGGCGGQPYKGKSGMESETPQSPATPQSPDLLHTALDLRWLSANWWDSRKVLRPGRWRLPPSSRKSSHVKMQPPLLLSCFLRQGFHWNTVTVWEDTIGQEFRGLELAQTCYMFLHYEIKLQSAL